MHVQHAFLINDDKILSSLRIYKYNFTFSLFCTTFKLTNDKEIPKVLKKISTFRPFLTFHFNSPHSQSLKIGGSWSIKDYADEDFYKFI